MTARDHNKILWILFLIWGGLQIFGLGLGLLMMLGAGGVALSSANSQEAAPIAAMFGFMSILMVVLMIFAIPAIIAGLKMRKEKSSAKIWVIIAAILALFSFPFGTALGVYALWFMFGDQGKSLYNGVSSNSGFTPPSPNSWR